MLSKVIFHQLPAFLKEEMKPWYTTATLADGSGMPVHGLITLPGKIRNLPFKPEVLVSRVSDGVLGKGF